MREAGAGLVGRAAGGFELGDALLQRPIVELGRVDLGERQLVDGDAPHRRHRRQPLNDVHVGVVDADVLKQPVAARPGKARAATISRLSAPPSRS